jgi:hypothetical protein
LSRKKILIYKNRGQSNDFNTQSEGGGRREGGSGGWVDSGVSRGLSEQEITFGDLRLELLSLLRIDLPTETKLAIPILSVPW